MNTDKSFERRHPDSFRSRIEAALSGMTYLSESEAPLQLLDWQLPGDLDSVLQKISAELKWPCEAGEIESAVEFLRGVRRQADPADTQMTAYVAQYERLFELLNEHAQDVVVVRCGISERHMFIVALGALPPVVIHTTAIET